MPQGLLSIYASLCEALLVPLAGIEPALLAELDFESSASTSSATGAFRAQPEGCGREAGGLYRARPAGQPAHIHSTRISDTNCPNARGPQASQQGRMQWTLRINRFRRVIDTAKHSSVIALRLDSAARAG